MALDLDLLQYLMGFLSERRQELFDQILDNRTRHISVLVEELYQPHNTNAVLRSCECFGIQDVHVIETQHEFDISTGISMGSHKWLNIHKHNSTLTAIKDLKEKGYAVVATCLHEDAVAPENYDISKPTISCLAPKKRACPKRRLKRRM